MSNMEEAERLSRRRASLFVAMTALLAIQQGAFYAQPAGERAVDYVRMGA
jgi:hypothetical protein